MRFWKSWGNKMRFSWVFGVLTGILFLGLGILQGQFAVMWKKAVMICMECIGIG